MTAAPDVRAAVTKGVQRHRDDLIDLSHRIHANPEVAWEEERASAWVSDAMADGGFAVTSDTIPDHTEGQWYVRGLTLAQMQEVQTRVLKCFEAGALATGCTLTIGSRKEPYADFRNDAPVLAAYVANAEGLGRRFATTDDPATRMNRASTDMGNVSQVVPAIHPYIGIESLPAVNHQREFAAASVSAAADRAVLDAAAALALTVADVASDAQQCERLLAGAARSTHA